jgi:hypothetical protein
LGSVFQVKKEIATWEKLGFPDEKNRGKVVEISV